MCVCVCVSASAVPSPPTFPLEKNKWKMKISCAFWKHFIAGVIRQSCGDLKHIRMRVGGEERQRIDEIEELTLPRPSWWGGEVEEEEYNSVDTKRKRGRKKKQFVEC